MQNPYTLLKSPFLARPFIKWAGGKGQLIETLASFLPPEMKSGKIKKYAEPFIGGGSLFFYIAQEYTSIESYYISDLNEEIILAYKTIKHDVKSVIDELQSLEKIFYSLNQIEQKEFYYQIRSNFNCERSKTNFHNFEPGWIKRTSMLIFLNRTCYNGLFRVNSKGLFNVPFGDYKNPKICDKENLLAVSYVLQNAEIKCGDFTLSNEFIDENSFVYFDPPYRPISKTSNFTSYSKYNFDESEQIRLAHYFYSLSAIGAKLMLSNSDPTNENPQDRFFENLYKDFKIRRVDASRMINCNGKRRGKIRELVITNYSFDQLI